MEQQVESQIAETETQNEAQKLKSETLTTLRTELKEKPVWNYRSFWWIVAGTIVLLLFVGWKKLKP